MTLTRKLYELDEVVASFMLALRKKRLDESLFWLEELEVSAEDELAAQAIFNIWFLRVGILSWPFFLAWKTHKNSLEGRCGLVKAWMRVQGLDSTLWRSYCLGFATDKAWDNSLIRKPALDWWVVGSADPIECAELWFRFLGEKEKPLAIDTDSIACDYDITNIRMSRKFSIPYDCHLGLTRRGLNWNSSKVLHDMSLYSLLASPIWAGILDDYVDKNNEWRGDDEKEAFYDKYFKGCDVPDEWSVANREKSHGLPPSKRTSCAFSQWWASWVPSEHKYIYGRAGEWLNQWVKSKTITSVFEDLASMEISKDKRSYDICKEKLIIYN
jgi:hypothetical protein